MSLSLKNIFSQKNHIQTIMVQILKHLMHQLSYKARTCKDLPVFDFQELQSVVFASLFYCT